MAEPVTLRSMASIYLWKDDKVLLLYRQGSRVVNNVWIGSAGGHLEPEEISQPLACALRELQEELELSADDITQPQLRYVTLRMTGSEIRQNYYYFARLKTDRPLSSSEGRLQWFEQEELKGLPMAYTARWMMDHYLETGHATDHIYGGIADGEKVVFTPLPSFG